MAASTRFEVVADELYAATRGEFVPLREERAAAARKRGETDLANRIHRLRKPTTAAALVNLLARHHAEAATEMRRASGCGQPRNRKTRRAERPRPLGTPSKRPSVSCGG